MCPSVDVEAVSAVAIPAPIACGSGGEGSPASGGDGAVTVCCRCEVWIFDARCGASVFSPGEGKSVEESSGGSGLSVVDEQESAVGGD